jgi:hypothetical protein
VFAADGEAAFEAADEVTDADVARPAGEPVPPAAADLALEESATAKREQDRLEKLIRQILVLGEVAGLHIPLWPQTRELHDGTQPVFGSLG